LAGRSLRDLASLCDEVLRRLGAEAADGWWGVRPDVYPVDLETENQRRAVPGNTWAGPWRGWPPPEHAYITCRGRSSWSISSPGSAARSPAEREAKDTLPACLAPTPNWAARRILRRHGEQAESIYQHSHLPAKGPW